MWKKVRGMNLKVVWAQYVYHSGENDPCYKLQRGAWARPREARRLSEADCCELGGAISSFSGGQTRSFVGSFKKRSFGGRGWRSS